MEIIFMENIKKVLICMYAAHDSPFHGQLHIFRPKYYYSNMYPNKNLYIRFGTNHSEILL